MTRKRVFGVVAAVAAVLVAAGYGYVRHGLGYAIWITAYLTVLAVLLFLYVRRKGKP